VSRICQSELGPNLRAARKSLGMSLSDVAKEVGTSKSYLSQLERGLICNPNAEMLQRVCLALGVEVVFGHPAPIRSQSRLAYASPIAFDGPSSPHENSSGNSAVNLLKKALSNSSIPLTTRQLLERQVQALVHAVLQDHKAE